VETDAPRLLARGEARQGVGRDDDAPAPVEQIDIDDAPGQRDRPETALQHRRAALPARLLHDREPGAAKGEHDRGVAQHRPAAKQNGGNKGGGRCRETEPPRRLDCRREVERDPHREENRQPQDAAVALGRERLGEVRQRPPTP